MHIKKKQVVLQIWENNPTSFNHSIKICHFLVKNLKKRIFLVKVVENIAFSQGHKLLIHCFSSPSRYSIILRSIRWIMIQIWVPICTLYIILSFFLNTRNYVTPHFFYFPFSMFANPIQLGNVFKKTFHFCVLPYIVSYMIRHPLQIVYIKVECLSTAHVSRCVWEKESTL